MRVIQFPEDGGSLGRVDAVERLDGNGRVEQRWELGGITRAWLDQALRLVVELENDELRVLDEGGASWTVLRPAE